MLIYAPKKLFPLVSLSFTLALAGCGFIQQDHLTADYVGDFTQADCETLTERVTGASSDSVAVGALCAEQLGTLGQDGFNAMMHESLVGLENFNQNLEDLQNPENYTP